MRALAYAVLSIALAGPVQGQPSGVLERDLGLMESWLPGEFDNAEQVFFAAEQKASAQIRLHASVTKVGPHVFRIVHYADNSPAKVVDDWLFTASVDTTGAGLKLTAPDCEIRLKRRANQFVGGTAAGQCGDKAAMDMTLTDREVWRGPVRLQRAHAWTCWMAVPRKSGKADDWYYAAKLNLADQGGEAWVTTDETPPQTLGYRLRQVDWPGGTNQNALTLYVFREGEEKAAAYSWASPEASRIGINVRWMQGSCSRPVVSGPVAP